MLRGDRFVQHDLRVSDQPLVSIPYKDKVDLRFGVPAIKRGEVRVTFSKLRVHDGEVVRLCILKYALAIGVTWPVSETTMTAAIVSCCSNVTPKITCNNNYVQWRNFCCLLIKQKLCWMSFGVFSSPKLILVSFEATSLRSIRGEELIHSPFSSDNDLHQAVAKTLHACQQRWWSWDCYTERP
ncbi:unnamed protein product [Heligmosomoides polygyrus]|uniref:Uncharacterized protein n=1 Tax=Heligmosomoides polygyrus TaxID=6339 RepID=A0A183G273_HELPZ|nr:unnamed protein product [Heligmosomoides polygyrus]